MKGKGATEGGASSSNLDEAAADGEGGSGAVKRA